MYKLDFSLSDLSLIRQSLNLMKISCEQNLKVVKVPENISRYITWFQESVKLISIIDDLHVLEIYNDSKAE